jgi:hypothetical protein
MKVLQATQVHSAKHNIGSLHFELLPGRKKSHSYRCSCIRRAKRSVLVMLSYSVDNTLIFHLKNWSSSLLMAGWQRSIIFPIVLMTCWQYIINTRSLQFRQLLLQQLQKFSSPYWRHIDIRISKIILLSVDCMLAVPHETGSIGTNGMLTAHYQKWFLITTPTS